jgi:MFS family permease
MAALPRTLLTLAFVVVGIGNGLLDVFVNVGGQMAETRHRRPVLQFLHASYNVGGIVGALGAGLALVGHVPFRTVLYAVVAIFGGAAIWCAASPWLRAQPAPEATESRASVAVLRRTPALILPAIVVLSAFMVEGSMDIWSVIYVRKTLEATVLAGAIAFALFSLAMAVGRLFAGRILFGLGYRRTIRISGIGALVSGPVAGLAGSAPWRLAFLFLGFFISAAAPAAFGMVSGTDEDPALAIAAMTTVGYTGFVIGPPIMGWLAQTAGLRATMLVLVSVTIGVFLGGVLGPKGETQERLR